MQTTSGESNLRDVLRSLRRHRVLIVVCMLVGGGVALAASLSQQKQYEATAGLLFRDPGFDQKLFGSSYLPPSRDPAREAATNVRLVSLEVVAERAARRLGGVTPEQLKNKLDVSSAGQSDVVAINAMDPDPRRAAQIAQTVAEEYIAFRRSADRLKIEQARELVQSQINQLPKNATSSRNELQSRAEQLEVLRSLQTGNAELVQPARPPEQAASPRVKRNTVAGLLLGLLIGVAGAFARDRIDRRIKDPDTLEADLDTAVLGIIPASADLGSGTLPSPANAEAFRMLRARLKYFNVDRTIQSVLVTSAAPGDGKSTVAWHLAMAAATSGTDRVLLLEADMRKPSLAADRGVYQSPGLSELLTHNAQLEDVVQTVSIDSDGDGAGKTLSVIASGVLPPRPSELVESHRMLELLASLQDDYDFVVVDTPPTSIVSDAIPLIRQVSGVLLVIRVGKSRLDAAKQLQRQLTSLAGNVLGVVANGAPHAEAGYEAYGYAASDRPRAART